MPPETTTRAASLSLTALQGVVARCERFETDWRAGLSPVVADYLGGVDGPEGLDLLRRLLQIEAELKQSHGLATTVEDAPDPVPASLSDPGASTQAADPEATTRQDEGQATVVLPTAGSTAEASQPSRPGARFRKVRGHRSGGLGTVSLAHDEELGRQVALKEIQAKFADDPVTRARFVREAEITGRLEHPGIVPVYSMGTGDDGRPFYAMRFVGSEADGGGGDRRLLDAIRAFHKAEESPGRDPAARALALRELLGHFIAACDAIAYAHSRRVIHRDIKPANILLGPFGETLVVDWGLAKPLDRAEPITSEGQPDRLIWGGDSDLTWGGAIAGTPSYMAPEQASGDRDRVGLASDVYSLGATLYELLAGRPPHIGDNSHQVLIHAIRGDYLPPGQHKPGVAPALEAVCLKAMAVDPEGRYASPTALAADLKLWLADEPVSAYREPRAARLARWTRRRRTLVSSTLALLVTATFASILAAILIAGERKQVVRANRDLKATNQQLTRETDRAEAALRRSESNFKLARETVNRLLTQFASEGLATMPQSEGLRRQLARAAMDFNERFLLEAPDDPKVRAEAAANSRELGNIHRMLGDADSAVKSYDRAIELIAGLSDRFPSEFGHRMNMALIHIDAGELLRLNGRPREAERHYLRAIGEADRVPSAGSSAIERQQVRARGLYSRAEVCLDIGAYVESVRLYDEAIGLIAPLARRPKPGPTDALELAMILAERGEALRRAGRPRDAIGSIDESLAMLADLLRTSPDDNNLRYLRSFARIEKGRTLAIDPVESTRADGEFAGAIDELTSLTKEFTQVPNYQFLLAQALAARSETCRSSGRVGEAGQFASPVLILLESLVARFPNNWDYHGALGQALVLVGRIGESPAEVARCREQARVHLEKARLANPEGPDLRESLEWCISPGPSAGPPITPGN